VVHIVRRARANLAADQHQFVLIQSLWDGKLSGVILGTIPFHRTMFVLLALVILWSELALWLPYHMSR
jgi:TRAP-type C4-dicarboxylate transport system permease large subunit